MSNIYVHIPPPLPEQPPAMVAGNPEEQAATEESSYDPGDDTVEEVKAYVEENPDQAEQVLMMEQAGKNRVTLTDWLEESLEQPAEEPAPEGPT